MGLPISLYISTITVRCYNILWYCFKRWVCLCLSCLRNSYFSVNSEKCNCSLKKGATATSCTFLTKKCNCTFYEKSTNDAYFLRWLRNKNFSGACYLANLKLDFHKTRKPSFRKNKYSTFLLKHIWSILIVHASRYHSGDCQEIYPHLPRESVSLRRLAGHSFRSLCALGRRTDDVLAAKSLWHIRWTKSSTERQGGTSRGYAPYMLVTFIAKLAMLAHYLS
jgi:hypothetical protein